MNRPGGPNTTDTYVWDFSKTGHYTVKSAYWVYQNTLRKKAEPAEVLQPSYDAIYKQIWDTSTTPKIQHFLWRSLSNTLPVADSLHYRHLTKDPSCMRCQGPYEDANHLLFTCPFARLVWALSSTPAPPNGEMSSSLPVNLNRVLSYASAAGTQSEVCWILWRLWKNRNQLLFRGMEYTADGVLAKAKEDAEDWYQAQRKNQAAQGNCSTGNNKWEPPPEGWLKCNVDGAWANDGNQGGIGWVLRDHTGHVLWIGAQAVPTLRSALEVEAESLRYATKMVASFGYNQVIFESDAKNLVSALTTGEESPFIKPQCQDIFSGLGNIPNCKVVFKPRGCNGVADRIAKEALSFTNYVPKLYSILPSWILQNVEKDKVSVMN